MKKNICLIPARGGSKRIKDKNLKKIKNLPFIAHAIIKAKKSGIFDKVIVSTDSKKIMNISKKYGAICSTLRPKRLSNNFATIYEVIKFEFLDKNLKNYDYIFCIYPCSGPQIKIKQFSKALKIIKNQKADHLLTTMEYDYPPQKALIKNNKSYMILKNKKYYKSRTQDLPKQYKDTGSLYIYTKKLLLSKKRLKTGRLQI